MCLSSPLPIRNLYASSCSIYSHVHSIPSSYSYYNTTSSPCSSIRRSSAPHSRCPLQHPCYLTLSSPGKLFSEIETEAEVILTPLTTANSLVARLMAWVDEGAHDGDHAQVRLLSIPHFWLTGLLMTARSYVYVCAGLVAMPISCAVSGSVSVTVPWQPTVTPAAPLAHASSLSPYPPWSPHVPPYSASLRRCTVCTCERLNRAFITTAWTASRRWWR